MTREELFNLYLDDTDSTAADFEEWLEEKEAKEKEAENDNDKT